MSQRCETLGEMVRHHAEERGERPAYTYLVDGARETRSLTWRQLHRNASARAAALAEAGASGAPVLLFLPSGLEFVQSLIGCWYAGAIPVPICLPRNHRAQHRVRNLIADCGAPLAIGADDLRQRLISDQATGNLISKLRWISPEGIGPGDVEFAQRSQPQDLGLLQYTSGSTGVPRGVMVTHANLMENSAIIAEVCGHGPDMNAGGWLPLFHDMGLIGMVAQSAFCGAHLVFMAPERFLMRPWSWLQMISDFRLQSSPAPNFAYDLCVEKIDEQRKKSLDLSCWRNALNGAEPVRPATLERFAAAFECCGFKRSAFLPCYGLAEATLFVTGRSDGHQWTTGDASGAPANRQQGHVGCGKPPANTRLIIVDPQTRRVVADGAIGEIWVAGASVAKGYWNNPQATEITFRARLESDLASRDTWLRTGDLGMIVDGELFITGRLRELIIIAGRNLFPIDIERTAEAAHSAIAISGVVAFSAEIDGRERLIVVAELRRAAAGKAINAAAESLDLSGIRRSISAAVAADHEIAPHEVILVRSGALPRTTSGKLNRGAARDAYLSNELERLEASENAVVNA